MLSEADLSEMARHERANRLLTHQEVAALLVERGRFVKMDPDKIARAERFAPGDGLADVRIAIVEELTGHQLQGPLWHLLEIPEPIDDF